jgi:drug/metabolite transporter (DMT)-like permease
VSLRSAGLTATVAIIWGLCFVLIQASLPSPAPILLAAVRALMGGGIVVLWVGLRRWWPATRRRETARTVAVAARSGLPSMPVLVALALTNAVLALGAMYLAAGRAEAAVASILAGGQPLVLAAAGWALFGERVSARGMIGLAVAMGGVTLVATTSSGATSLDGVALALLAAIAPAVGTVLMRKVAPTVDLLLTTSAQFLIGGAILGAVSALLEPWSAVRWSPATLIGSLVLGALGTGLAYVAWFWLLDRVPLVQLGAALFLVPVVGVAAAFVTGDRPATIALVGIAAVLGGIGIVSFGGAPPPEEAAAHDAAQNHARSGHQANGASLRPRPDQARPDTGRQDEH